MNLHPFNLSYRPDILRRDDERRKEGSFRDIPCVRQQRSFEISSQKPPSRTIPPTVGAKAMGLFVFPDFGVGASPLREMAK